MSNPAWMAQIPDHTRLRDVTMPASHDAGVSTAHNSPKLLPAGVSKFYVCQDQSIAGQLQSGARFFDMRFELNKGVPTSVHQPFAFGGPGGWGETARSTFEAIRDHLANNPSEVVIVRVSHTPHDAGLAVYAVQQEILAPTGVVWAVPGSLADTAFGVLRKKAIIAYEPHAMPTNPTEGVIRFAKYRPNDTSNNADGVITCGKYPNTNNINKIDYKAVVRTEEHRVHRPTALSHLFMLYWQMTGGNVKANTERVSSTPAASPGALKPKSGTLDNIVHLLDMLSGGQDGSDASYRNMILQKKSASYPTDDASQYPNVINLDFNNDNSCFLVIDFNRWARNLWS